VFQESMDLYRFKYCVPNNLREKYYYFMYCVTTKGELYYFKNDYKGTSSIKKQKIAVWTFYFSLGHCDPLEIILGVKYIFSAYITQKFELTETLYTISCNMYVSLFKPVQMHHLESIGLYLQVCITYCCAPTSEDLNYNKESKQQNGYRPFWNFTEFTFHGIGFFIVARICIVSNLLFKSLVIDKPGVLFQLPTHTLFACNTRFFACLHSLFSSHAGYTLSKTLHAITRIFVKIVQNALLSPRSLPFIHFNSDSQSFW
jgi:hypothetical protein